MSLPPAVLDLARRLGAQGPSNTALQRARAVFAQQGTLRTDPAGKWMGFTASQWMSAGQTAFCWRAKTGPLGALRVEDSLVADRAMGGVSILGLVPLARAQASPALLKGQVMRYLAELPWVPDAILCNAHLSWTVSSPETLSVSAAIGDIRGQVRFSLDREGLPARIEGLRPREEKGVFRERPWHGQFRDFRSLGGRLIPHQGAVAWVLDGEPCEVWRGSLTSWRFDGPGEDRPAALKS